LKSDGIY